MNAKALPLLLGSLLLAACGNVVVEGGGDSGGNNVVGNGNGNQLDAVAMTRAQNDILWEQYWATHDPSGSSSAGGGGTLDPNDLFLRLSDLGVSCGSPTVDVGCGDHYQLTLVVPQAYQQVGTYDLEDPALVAYSSMWESGTPNSSAPDDCPMGGGSIGPGTLEITSIDQNKVEFVVTFNGSIWSSDPSGQYSAPRCATP